MIKFSKPVMTVSEIQGETGIPKDYLYGVFHRPGQKVAWRSPGSRTILFDTAALSQHIEAQKGRECKVRRIC